MRLLLINHFENAQESLRSNRLRTLLTILGITLGVACMTTIMALSFGASKLINDQVGALGGNIAVIRPGSTKHIKSLRDIASPVGSPDSFTASSLTEKDYQSLQSLENVADVAPLMSINGSVRAGHQTVDDAPIIATTPALQTVSNLAVGAGQFLDNTTNQNTAVIGYQLAIDLFGTDQPIGQTFHIRGQQFTVIGVLKKVDDSVNYNNLDINHAALISLDSGKAFNQGIAQIRQINVRAISPKQLDAAVKDINNVLSENHDGEADFTVLTGKDISRPTSQVFAAVGAATSVVAAISLIIGGIGIMNIMLVGVAERTREIGIRKAVGASNYHITVQFLIESLVMSVSGGILGFILGYVFAFAAGLYLPFTPGFDWYIPAVSFGISVLVGTVFGIYPALRAARKNPIEALRQYY